MDKHKDKISTIDQIPSHILDLMLDVILEVMRAERGSIMLLDDKNHELTIKTARGLKKEIIQKTRVCLGNGVAGKVAANGQSVFLKGIEGERRLQIGPDDLARTEIDTAFVAPIKSCNGTLGVININSTHPNHEIQPEKERLVQEILNRFSEYLIQVELPPSITMNPPLSFTWRIFFVNTTHSES